MPYSIWYVPLCLAYLRENLQKTLAHWDWQLEPKQDMQSHLKTHWEEIQLSKQKSVEPLKKRKESILLFVLFSDNQHPSHLRV